MSSRAACVRVARQVAVAAALAVGAPFASAQAQDDFNPLPEGLRFAAQIGLAFSTLANVEPADVQTFSRHRSTQFSLRLSHNLGGPFVGFVEGGSAERGAQVSTPGEEDVDYRTRWWQAVGGVSLVGQCISRICPALDAGVAMSRNRQSVLYSQETGRPLGTIGVARYESSAILGVRIAIPQLRGLAVVVRHQEGLSNLPTNETRFRSRSQLIMLSVPLTQ